MIWLLVSFPPKVPLTLALPVITAVLPYTRTFISESSLEVSLVWPVLNAFTICDLSARKANVRRLHTHQLVRPSFDIQSFEWCFNRLSLARSPQFGRNV